jgi:hypothetical protein
VICSVCLVRKTRLATSLMSLNPGHGIINSDGELWKTQRKAGLKFFTGSNLETLIEEVLPSAYMQTRSVLLQHAQSGDFLDLEAIFLDLTTTVVGRLAYDVSSPLFNRRVNLMTIAKDGYQCELPIQSRLRSRLRSDRPPLPKPSLSHHRALLWRQVPLLPCRSQEIWPANRL